MLNNGLTVATHYMPKRVSVALGIWIRVGARYEKKSINGISHFLEHLLFKGTKSRTCEDLKQAIEGVGGSLNGFTSEELTCYLAKVPQRYCALALDILADMVLNARIDNKDVEMERKVILEEIRMYNDLPAHFVMELLSRLLWPNQPLGMNIAGEISSISTLARSQLCAFKQRFYQLPNVAIVACGNLRHNTFLQQCRRQFSFSRNGKINKFTKARAAQAKPKIRFQDKATEQTHLALGVHSLHRNHSQRFALALLHIILGANMSSRLFRHVREERGLAYDIGTAVKFFQDTGAFIIHAGIDNRRLREAVEIILGQLDEINKEGIGPQELKRAKEYYIGQLRLALEDTASYMLWLGEKVCAQKRLLGPEQVIQQVKKIEADEINFLAKKILRYQRFNLALIGPLKEKDKKIIQARIGL
jgi:predicted Zn-dependent peptidase